MDKDLYTLHKMAMVPLMKLKATTNNGKFFTQKEFEENKREVVTITHSVRIIENKLIQHFCKT